jgi:hypothetical protein
MKRLGVLLVPVFLGLTAAGEAATAFVHLTLQSPPGEWIGGGQNWDITYTPSNTVWFYTTLSSDASYLTLNDMMPWTGQDNWLEASFSSTQLGHPLTTGLYTDAQRAPFASPGHPGLDVTFQHRGSNVLTGSFDITELDYHESDGSWVVDDFDASFTQYSDFEPQPLTGTITYCAATPEPATLLAMSIGAGAFLARRRRVAVVRPRSGS